MPERILSRRDFLKFLGYGAVAISFAPLVKFGGFHTELKSLLPTPALAQSSGSWALGQNTTVVAIHAALLPSGKIFYLAGSGYHRDRPNGPFDARILDVNTGSEINFSQTEDLFCIGITHLPNGNVLLAGGTLMYDTNPDNCSGNWHGLKATYEVDWTSESMFWVASMAHGRWYPSLVSLPDGKVFITNGFDEYGTPNRLVEIYDPNSKTWSKKFDPNGGSVYCVGANEVGECPGAGSPCYGGPNNGAAPSIGVYPRMHLMPSGLIITCGAQVNVRSWDPATGRWALLTQNSVYRHYGASFLLPLHNDPAERGKILLVGGSPASGDYATTSAEILDFDLGTSTNPVVRQIAPITYRRKMQAPVILPNGKCVIFGGSERNNTIPVRIPEIFDPVTETWQALPSASVNRVYHQVSLLLPDGRVWTAGSTVASGTEENRTEIYSPSYLFQGPRPVISGTPNVGDYGATISIPTPDAPTASSVSLVRLMSTTHHYEANQRLIWLQIVNRGPSTLTVSAPINNKVAPPGPYMIHVLNSLGVPSVAKIIQIPGTGSGGGDTTPPGKVLGLTVTPISSSRLDLAWTANTEPDLGHYNIYRGTTAGFAVNPATDTPLAQPTTNSYSNTGLTGSTTYYYKVAAVDASGNIGTLSDERSGTTLDSTAPAKVLGLTVTPISSSRLDLAWTANTEPDLGHYNIYRGTTAGFAVNPATDTPLAQPTTNSYSNTGLTESTTYYYKVAAVDASGNIGVLSDEGSGTTQGGGGDTTPPAKVLGLTVTPISSSRLDLAWTANTEPDLGHYNIYRGTTAGFAVNPATDTPLAQPVANSYSDSSGLTQGTTYYYKVAAVDTSANIGALSDEGSGTPGAIFYDVASPGNKAVAINSGGSIRFGEEALNASSAIIGKALRSWKVRLRRAGTPSGIVLARVRRKSDDGIVATFNESIDSTTLGTSFAEYTFTLTSPYTIQNGDRIMIEYGGPASVQIDIWTVDKFDGSQTRRIRRDSTGYVGGNSEDVVGTMSSILPAGGGGDTTPPSKVLGLTVSPISGSQLNLAWTANPEPDLGHYNIYRGTTAGFAVNPATDTPLAQPTTNSYSNTGLTESTTYYYKVAAVDTSANIGLLSDEKSGTTQSSGGDTTPPAKVLGLTVTPISSSRLDLAWTANTEPDLGHYNIYRGTTAGFAVNPATDTPLAQPTTNSYSDSSGLSQGTTYYYKVAAVDTSGNIGILSDEKSATTSVTPIFYDVAIPGNTGAALNVSSSHRYGEEAQFASSILIGKSIKSWKVRLRKSGTPSGIVSAKIRRKSDDAIVVTFNESIDSTALGTNFAEYTFTLNTAYTIQNGDRILIEYNGPSSVIIEIWNVDKFDGANTRRVRYTGTSYAGSNTEDITGTMSST